MGVLAFPARRERASLSAASKLDVSELARSPAPTRNRSRADRFGEEAGGPQYHSRPRLPERAMRDDRVRGRGARADARVPVRAQSEEVIGCRDKRVDVDVISIADSRAGTRAPSRGSSRPPADRERSAFSDARGAGFIKPENLQKTGSFKIRGAFNRIAAMPDAEKARGVIAASAGNHGQALSYSASRAGVKATIVMPRTAAIAKIDATRSYARPSCSKARTTRRREAPQSISR